MTDEHHVTRRVPGDVLLHQVRVLDRIPVARRWRGLPEAGKVEQMDAVRCMEGHGDAAQGLAVAAPPVEKHEMAGVGLGTGDLGDERGARVLESLDDTQDLMSIRYLAIAAKRRVGQRVAASPSGTPVATAKRHRVEETMEQVVRVTDAVQRLRGVFLEVPGTQLSLAQASRLSGLDQPMCESVLSALEDAQFLKRGRDGCYQQRD